MAPTDHIYVTVQDHGDKVSLTCDEFTMQAIAGMLLAAISPGDIQLALAAVALFRSQRKGIEAVCAQMNEMVRGRITRESHT